MKKLEPLRNASAYISVGILCFVSFTYYEILIYLYPSVYWYDAHIRLALRDQILLGHWLPLLQVVIVLISRISVNLIVLRSFLAIVAVATIVSMVFLAKRLFSDKPTGLIAGMFLAFNMMFVALTIVPYPEVVFIGLSLSSLVLLDEPVYSRRFYFGVLAINLACLTRYEGWILSAILVIENSIKIFSILNWRRAIWSTIKLALLFSLGPLAWIFFGFSDSGNMIDRVKSIVAFETMTSVPQLQDHLFTKLNLQHLSQFSSQFFQLLSWQFHSLFLILAGLGLCFALFKSGSKLPHIRILAFLLLDWMLLAFVQPWGFGNLRQPFILEIFLTLYSANGLNQSLRWLFNRLSIIFRREKILQWAMPATMILSFILSAWLAQSTFKFITTTAHQVDFYIPYKIANWLNLRLKSGDTILIVDDMDEYYPYALATYVNYPFEDILDDRLNPLVVSEKLKTSQMVYVIEFYKSRDKLSLPEQRILNDLESQRIQADFFVVNAINIWYVSADQLIYSP